MNEKLIEYGVIHCHTENSLKDSTLSAIDLVKRARQLGAPAVTITDHGTLTGIFEFDKAIAEVNANESDPWHGVYDIKGIPGVEAYVKEEGEIKRTHLLLLAKNYQGYKAISKAVTMSNENLDGSTPCMNHQILTECFGEGAGGHGNVIATSACAGGVLAQILLRNSAVQKEIKKLKVRAAKYSSPEDETYKANLALLQQYGDDIQQLAEQRDSLKKLVERKFALRERGILKLTEPEKSERMKELEADKAESAQAAELLEKVKVKIANAKRRETAARQACKAAEAEHEKWNRIHAEIRTLETGLASDHTLEAEAEGTARWYRDLFGDGNFYIELQYHNLPDEETVMPILARIAERTKIPVVACNDVHYSHKTEDCNRARKIVSSTRFDRWPEEGPDDGEYYVKTDAELRESLLKILDTATVDAAFAGIKSIVASCNVEFPHEMHFPQFAGGVTGETSQQRLRRLVEEGIKKRYPDEEFKYRDRVEYELSIIEKMQYTDYLCIVQDYLEYGRNLALATPEGVGYSIGPGRGSAAGSLVCYLIGITSVDPMPLNLLFERFLNPDRVSSPDIDADLSNEVRDAVLEYVKGKYGQKAVCSIITKGRLKAKAAIKTAARAHGHECGTPGKFLDLGNAMAKAIPAEPNAVLVDSVAKLRAEFVTEDAQRIIDDAILIENTAVNLGMHAAGVIIADNDDVSEYVPLAWNSEKQQWCCQCDMIEAEMQAGLLKFDFLGLRNLDIITETLRLIKRNTGLSIDIEKIPQESNIYREIFAKGKTNFVFQFESDGMKNLLQKFQPENLEHLIMLNALFRPGPLQYANSICEVKRGKKKPEYICEEAKDVLKVTYGYAVYQEQIMQICNKVAGFTLGEADLVRRYMSKKKGKELAKFKPKFISGLTDKGVSADAAEQFWDQLMDFARYAFNKSHAAVYAVIAYYTAWLKYHYPTEYMTAILNHTPIKKLPAMIHECKELGIKILPPNINRSGLRFVGKDSEILFGLSNIKNIGACADTIIEVRRNGEFRSFKDFIKRTLLSSDVAESLIDAGALDDWCGNRAAMKLVFSDLTKTYKSILQKDAVITDIEALVKTVSDEKTRKKEERKLENAIKAKQKYTEQFNSTIIPIGLPEDHSGKLSKEKELLGMYVSGHPLDDYPDAKTKRTICIDEATENNKYEIVAGIVTDVNIKYRKSDGKPMVFFTIEDETGSCECCCFTKAYEAIGNIFEENAVMYIEGRLHIEEGENEDDETITKIHVDRAGVLKPKEKKILVTVRGLHVWAESVYPQLRQYADDNGSQVILYDCALGQFRNTTMRLSRTVLQEDILNAELSEADI